MEARVSKLLFFGSIGNGRAVWLISTIVLACVLLPANIVALPSISYIQGNYSTPQSAQSTVSVRFTAAQLAGDLNIVVVGWNDSRATVSAVTDSNHNTYSRAVGPTVQKK